MLKATLTNGLSLSKANSLYVRQDGTTPLTANWNAGSYRITTNSLALGQDTVAGVVNGTSFTTRLASWVDDGNTTISELGMGRAENTSASRGATIFGGRSRGTFASPTIVQNGDTLMQISAVGYDGTDYAMAGNIVFKVDGTPGSNDMPTKMSIELSPSGSQTPAEVMSIDKDGVLYVDGQIGIGTTPESSTIKFVAQMTNGQINLRDSNVGGGTVPMIGTDTNTDLSFGVGNNVKMTIDYTTGYIGMGTYNPVSPLNINQTTDSQDNSTLDKFGLVISNPANDTGEEVGIGFRISATIDNTVKPGGAITFERTDSGSAGDLKFKTLDTGNNLLTRMVIDENGSVGILNSSPSYALDVTGEINASTGYRVGGTAGATGTFTTVDSKTVTVTNGIITSIV